MYRNEREVGRAVRDSGVPHEQVFLTTKLPPGAAGRERRTLDNSLRALGGVVLEGYSPFKNTDLRHPVLAEIAARHGVTPARSWSAGMSTTRWW